MIANIGLYCNRHLIQDDCTLNLSCHAISDMVAVRRSSLSIESKALLVENQVQVPATAHYRRNKIHMHVLDDTL